MDVEYKTKRTYRFNIRVNYTPESFDRVNELLKDFGMGSVSMGGETSHIDLKVTQKRKGKGLPPMTDKWLEYARAEYQKVLDQYSTDRFKFKVLKGFEL